MCGLVGMIARDEDAVRRIVPRMSAAQVHRGPDDAGEDYIRRGPWTLGLGFRRLAILDLNPTGHQPMIEPDTDNSIIFNGEIYNFRVLRQELAALGVAFRGTGDTEMLLHACTRWGAAALDRLEGMFALAFWNETAGQLLLARDHAGIKPLYVWHSAEVLLFASEVRAILASGLVPAKVDRAALGGLLAYGAVQHPRSLFHDIHSLPAGSSMRVDLNTPDRLTIEPPKRFWSYPAVDPTLEKRPAIERVRELLDLAVRDHLVADVPVGIFLSSGLDSTILAGLASDHAPHLQSFTVGFADQPAFDEQDIAARTAEIFGLVHTHVQLRDKEMADTTQEWLDKLDQPSMDGLNVFIISKVVHARGMKVALSGLGGDELFGGYPSFRDVPRLRRLWRYARVLPRGLRPALAHALTLGRPSAVRAKLLDMLASDGSRLALTLQRRRTHSARQLQELGLNPEACGLTADWQTAAALAEQDFEVEDDIAAVSRIEAQFYQGNMLLRDADQTGMAHSLEIRVPLLDRRLCDFVHRVPGAIRYPPGAPTKYLLRRAFPDLLRAEVADQSKRGFTLPICRWMVGPLREISVTALEYLKRMGLVDPVGVQKVWESFEKEPDSPLWTRAFTLVVLGHFLAKTRATL
jgi:asparagine synthase (glutamine-hydrolysing)